MTKKALSLGVRLLLFFKALHRIVASLAAAAAGASSSFNNANSSRPPDALQPKSKTKQKPSAASEA